MKCFFFRYTLLFVAFLLQIHLAQAQKYDIDSLIQHDAVAAKWVKEISGSFDIFDDSAPLKLTLTTDFKALKKNTYKDEYQDATLKVDFNDTLVVNRNIKIKTRGHMRKGSCYFPPLKLNFPKEEPLLKQMKHFDKIKMVVPCKSGDIFQQYLLAEYCIYKFYNLITDQSFRARLLDFTLVDTSGKMKPHTGFAFLIETDDQLAERNNAMAVEPGRILDIQTDPIALANTYLFEYMIGNTDWSIVVQHNIQLIKSKDPTISQPVAVPYDFDYSGIINTTYAVPDVNLGIKTVRTRVYRGVCALDKNYLLQAADRFKSNKSAIYQILEDDTHLSKSMKRNMSEYLDEFYSEIENDRIFQRNIIEACR